LSVDTSIYYIDWKDIQVALINPSNGLGFSSNGGNAKSEGLELSVQSKPLPGLTISTALSWNEAVLTQAFPAGSAQGAVGDRLPYSARFSGNLSLEQKFPISRTVTGFIEGQLSYVGDRQAEFASFYATSAQRQYLPPYARTDLLAGADYGTWTLNLFVNNLADKRGILFAGPSPIYNITIIQPRTAGFSVVKKF
jgi:iron complex outermembrane recepter protein